MGQSARDITFVLRVWLEPDSCEPRGRLLISDDDQESTAVGRHAIVQLVENALGAFLNPKRSP